MNIKNYGVAKEHNQKSKEIYEFISELDFKNGDFLFLNLVVMVIMVNF